MVRLEEMGRVVSGLFTGGSMGEGGGGYIGKCRCRCAGVRASPCHLARDDVGDDGVDSVLHQAIVFLFSGLAFALQYLDTASHNLKTCLG